MIKTYVIIQDSNAPEIKKWISFKIDSKNNLKIPKG
jgi:hypothetical protein